MISEFDKPNGDVMREKKESVLLNGSHQIKSCPVTWMLFLIESGTICFGAKIAGDVDE